jgi:hypothetical protein
LIAALATADPRHGAALMLAFGIGTLPNLLAIGAVLGRVPRLVRSRVSRALFAAVIMGVGAFGIVKSIQPMAHAGVHAPSPTPAPSPSP